MKSLAVIFLLITFGSLFAQGEYIERGQNAYGISLSAGYHPKLLSISGSAAVSNSGTFDFGIGYGYLFSREADTLNKSTSTVVTPFAAVHILKQDDTNPVSLSARIEFQVHRITTKDESGQASLGSWAIGISAFHRFGVSEKFQVQPLGAISFYKPERFPGEPSTGMTPALELGAAFIYKSAGVSKMILRPSVSFSKDETVYSLSFEFVDFL